MKIPFISKNVTQIAQKVSAGMTLHMTGLRPANWSARNYKSFAKEAYAMNVIAASAINRVANAVATMEWEAVLPSGDVVTTHPYLDLINNPNPIQSGAEWWRAKVSYLLLNGNSYDERVLGSRMIPKELWTLRPDRMTVIPSQTGLPSGYEYKVGQQKIIFDANPVTGESDIRHTKLFHPTDDWYGLSPVEAGAFGVDQHNETMKWIQALLQNSARPSGALTIDNETSLSDEEFNRLKAEIDEQYAGSGNAGRPMLLEGGLKWSAMGLSPVDMEILRVKESAARDIALAFGVPPLLLNIPGDNTYANYREARLGFYEDTIIPFVEYEIGELNSWLSPAFGGAKIRPNLDSVEALADKRARMWKMADESDDLTLDESRELKGYKPIGGAKGKMLMSEIRALQKQPPITQG